MKKLLKNEICGSMNSAHLALFMEKVKHFGSREKKKEKPTKTQMCVWEAQNTLPKHTLSVHLGCHMKMTTA